MLYSNSQKIALISFTMLGLLSCKNSEFIKTKPPAFEVHSLDGSSKVKIKAYRLTYNPKADGFIHLSLNDSSEYEAKSVDGGSFSSINILLQDQEVLFDTIRREVVINKIIQQ